MSGEKTTSPAILKITSTGPLPRQRDHLNPGGGLRLSYYHYQIEVQILPAFGDRPLASLTPEEIAAWEMDIVRRGYTQRTARAARTMLVTILSDAIPRHLQVNPAGRRRGKGRRGLHRIARNESAEKAWATPLQAPLVAERCAALSGCDTDFVMVVTIAYTGINAVEKCMIGVLDQGRILRR